MRSFSGSVLTALAERMIKRRLFIWAETRSLIDGSPDPVGFHDDLGDLELGGREYHGAGSIVKVDTISAKSDFTIPNLNITFSGLHPNVSSAVRGRAISQAAITVSIGIYDMTTDAIITQLYPIFVGFIDQVEIVTPDVGGLSNIIFTCESISRTGTIKRSGVRAGPTLRELQPTDAFYDFAGAQRERTIYFGRRDPNTTRAS